MHVCMEEHVVPQPPTRSQRLAQRQVIEDQPLMYQTWRNLLFAHWSYDASLLQSLLPKGLHLDTFEGKAYIGVVPFFMQDVKPTFFHTMLPGFDFPELNVRTYVYNDKGIPGIWFLSLEASNWLAVQVAKSYFHLPYHHSQFDIATDPFSPRVDYTCQRKKQVATHFIYSPHTNLGSALPDTLDFFLVERYILFTMDSKGQLMMGRVHHVPYVLWDVHLESFDENALFWNQLPRTGRHPDRVVMSKEADVDIFPFLSI